jgi:hypothetical protein
VGLFYTGKNSILQMIPTKLLLGNKLSTTIRIIVLFESAVAHNGGENHAIT